MLFAGDEWFCCHTYEIFCFVVRVFRLAPWTRFLKSTATWLFSFWMHQSYWVWKVEVRNFYRLHLLQNLIWSICPEDGQGDLHWNNKWYFAFFFRSCDGFRFWSNFVVHCSTTLNNEDGWDVASLECVDIKLHSAWIRMHGIWNRS